LVVEEGAGKEGRRISRPQTPGLTDRAPPLRDLGAPMENFDLRPTKSASGRSRRSRSLSEASWGDMRRGSAHHVGRQAAAWGALGGASDAPWMEAWSRRVERLAHLSDAVEGQNGKVQIFLSV
jgi:hypothetical protein